jgi:hypothetical protein
MRADFILPAVLAAALGAMALYAATGEPVAALKTSPITCHSDAAMASLRDLPEASGLAVSQHDSQLFWTHNDSAEPYIFAVGADGRTRGRVRVAGASVHDWEAIATGTCAEGTCLFVGDIGDNDRRRRGVIVYKTIEPQPEASATEDAVAIEASYPEGPQDAEAMFVADGRLYVVTKGEGTPIRLYRFPSLDGAAPQRLELVATIAGSGGDKTYRVTDAAVSPDQRWVAMRTNDLVLFFDRHQLLNGDAGTPLAFDARSLDEPQGEGVAWSDPQTLFLAGEGEGAGTFARISCNLPA